MSDTLLDHPAVRRVQSALTVGGSEAQVIALASTARSAEDAARSIGCELGAIVKSLVFQYGEDPVLALIAGDRRCDTKALAMMLGGDSEVSRAEAEVVRVATGFTIGGVAPIGHPERLTTVIDQSLERFERIYAAAGHPHCVFPTTAIELADLTGGLVVDNIAIKAT